MLALVNNAGVARRRPRDPARRRGLGPRHRHQPDRRLPAHAPRAAPDDQGPLRARSSTSPRVVGPRANAGQANYAAAKAGLIGMTKTIAAEVARRGVTVNAVAPGFIATDMTEDAARRRSSRRSPPGASGTPEEVAAAVRFLASDDAGYVTGTTLFVDGGMSA